MVRKKRDVKKNAIPYDDIDVEMRELIRCINRVDGIETTGCCCGHGKSRAWILLEVESTEKLNKFMYQYFYCNHGWEVSLYITDEDIDNNNWNNLHFDLHTTDLIKHKDTLKYIEKTTKRMIEKQRNLICDKAFNKLIATRVLEDI